MTFIAQEQSIEGGSPLELFEFSYGADTWCYTSGDEEYTDTLASLTYLPIPINRGSLQFSGDLSKGSLDITLPYDIAFLELFRTSMPSGVVSLTVKRVHRTDMTHETIVMWKGRIINLEWQPTEVVLSCEPIRSSVQRYGLRRLFQVSCPHVLYGPSCGLARVTYQLSGTVSAQSGTSITVSGVSAFPADYFSGGYIEYTNGILNTTERRMITAHPGTTNVVTLISPAMNVDIGDTVKLYPGCDHSIVTCDSKFDNALNYGGFPYTPSKNPFSGELIY